MRCLSIREPWLSLILQGWKTIEVRTWNHNHRGLIALHASMATEQSNLAWFRSKGIIESWGPPGFILGLAELVDVYRCSNSTAEWAAAMCMTGGKWCWKFQYVWRLKKSIAMKGQLGLFNLPPEVAVNMVAGELIEAIPIEQKAQVVKTWR